MRSSRADSSRAPVFSSFLAASSGRCQKWHHVPVASRTILVWSGKLNWGYVSFFLHDKTRDGW